MKKAISLLLALVMCLSLCACGGGSETPKTEYIESHNPTNIQNETNNAESTEQTEAEPIETEPTYTTIEISLDNWQDYFQFQWVVSEVRNDFDELTGIKPQMKFSLKEEWVSVAEDMDVAVEYSCTNGYYCWFIYNIGTGEIVEGETSDDTFYGCDTKGTFTMRDIEKGELFWWGIHPDTFACEEGIATVVGTTYPNVEIVRIQGTFTIEE